MPTGNTQFRFQVADLNFHSDVYDWLVVNKNESQAQFKGVGTINGGGTYQFMLWGVDGDPAGGPTPSASRSGWQTTKIK